MGQAFVLGWGYVEASASAMRDGFGGPSEAFAEPGTDIRQYRVGFFYFLKGCIADNK